MADHLSALEMGEVELIRRAGRLRRAVRRRVADPVQHVDVAGAVIDHEVIDVRVQIGDVGADRVRPALAGKAVDDDRDRRRSETPAAVGGGEQVRDLVEPFSDHVHDVAPEVIDPRTVVLIREDLGGLPMIACVGRPVYVDAMADAVIGGDERAIVEEEHVPIAAAGLREGRREFPKGLPRVAGTVQRLRRLGT